MKIALLGRDKFGKSVLEAFLERGHAVSAVFCAPDRANAAPDPLKAGALERAIPVHQLSSLKTETARAVLRDLDVDLGVMAYVLQFVPQDFASIPRFGMIQYHPSLLPRYRGPSAINWPIIRGDVKTGLTIFRPSDGLDEGPVILQKETPIGPDDTVGAVYFGRLFPMGIAALVEGAELVAQGGVTGRVQDESEASYEGWCKGPESRINWHNHVDIVYNLIRGCDPAPGAWCELSGKQLVLHDVRKHPLRRFSSGAGPIGAVAAITDAALFINAQGGQIEVQRVKYDGGEKVRASEFCTQIGLKEGALLV